MFLINRTVSDERLDIRVETRSVNSISGTLLGFLHNDHP